MFQNPKSWNNWKEYFTRKGYNCIIPAWPFHEGEPAALRQSPPAGLGDLHLDDIILPIETLALETEQPIIIGHSVGGLIAQLLLIVEWGLPPWQSVLFHQMPCWISIGDF